MFVDQPGLAAKWLQYLAETLPGLTNIAVLRQPTNATGQWRAVQSETERRRIETRVFDFEAQTLDGVFREVAAARPQALMILSSPLVVSSRARLSALAMAIRIPSITMFRVYAEAGGLMAFGPDPMTMGHRAASYVIRILRGTAPADLPVEQPSRFEPGVNLKTARALGVTLPYWILAAADAVFE